MKTPTTQSCKQHRRHLGLEDEGTNFQIMSTNSDFVPVDIIMEIFKRLPIKTLARFLCVSKLWASIIRHRDFMKLFQSSSTRSDRLFFTMKRDEDENEECLFFSLETLNQGEDLIATYHKTDLAYPYTTSSSYVNGLICFGTALAYGLVVYNTSTKRSITLPKFDSQSFVIKHFLGYDPIDDVYKVLCMTGSRLVSQETKLVLQVLTLGNENSSWKIIESGQTLLPVNRQICINGVLYYEAIADTRKPPKDIVFMSFDVRSEKFDLIKKPSEAPDSAMMRKYEGKLAIMSSQISDGRIVLWVLEDALKHEWLKKVFDFPNSCITLFRFRFTLSHSHRLVDVTDAGEFIFVPFKMCVPLYAYESIYGSNYMWEPRFYVLYYDPKGNSMRKVKIKGIKEHKELLRWNEPVPQRYSPVYHFSSSADGLMFL